MVRVSCHYLITVLRAFYQQQTGRDLQVSFSLLCVVFCGFMGLGREGDAATVVFPDALGVGANINGHEGVVGC